MAYSRRSLKRKTTKKRTATKRKSPKARKTSRGMKAPKVAEHRKTGYARALMDPIKGPLVGIPTFVPIDSHRERVRLIGNWTTSTKKTRIYFNPRRMIAGANSFEIFAPVQIFGGDIDSTGDSARQASIFGNAQQVAGNFQQSTVTAFAADSIDNADGIRGRCVSSLFRVCNTSSANNRAGVFTALHEKHHKTLEDFTSEEIASTNDAIIKPAADGSYVNLLYRPVKPEEVEDWQSSPLGYRGELQSNGGDAAIDGTLLDQYPGFMVVEYEGPVGTNLHIEAYAIVEYVGESLSTLSRPGPSGGGKAAEPKDIRKIAIDAAKVEQGTLVDLAPHIERRSERLGAALVTMKAVTKYGETVSHIEDLSMHEDAHLADLAYFSEAHNGDLAAINEHIQSLPDYVSDIKGFVAVRTSDDGMNVVLRNEATGETVVSFAGTVNSSDKVVEHWTVNNKAIAFGEEQFRNTPRYEKANWFLNEAINDYGKEGTRVVGHSQGGAVAIMGSADHGVPATVFNPGVPHDFSAGRAPIHVYRNPADIVSVNSIFGDRGFKGVEGGNYKVTTVPFKEGTIAERSIMKTIFNGHKMDEFMAADDAVAVLDGGKVAVTRMSHAASVLGVVGAGVATYETASETVGDWKVDLAEHGKVKGTAVAVGDTAINVGKAVVDWTEVGSTMAYGATLGEAIFPPGGAVVGAVIGGAVGVLETIGIDKVASGMKNLWHKFWD